MIYYKLIYLYLLITVVYILYDVRYAEVNILIGSSFKKWSVHFGTGVYKCNNRLKCLITNNKSKRIDYILYNAWTPYITKNLTYKVKRIIWSTEKMSWKKEMIKIGLGLSNFYYGGIDYRLFYSPNHFSQPYIGKMKNTLLQMINNAKSNIKNIDLFMKRKSVIYIQKINYPKRTNLVKEMMKFLDIDSYGKNLNNKRWPKGKSKVDIIKNYKFCLAIENSIQTSTNNGYYSDDIDLDYSTEKLFDCLEGGSIPIYYGPKNSNLFLPNNHSAIIMGKFKKLEDIIIFIKSIENSPHKLFQYISWVNSYSLSWYKRFSDTFRYSKCKLCEWAYNNI